MIAALFCGLFYGAFVLSAVQEMERIRRRKRMVEEIEAILASGCMVGTKVDWGSVSWLPESHECTCDPCVCHGPEMSAEEATERIEEALRDMSRYYYVTGTPDAPFDIHKATHAGYEDG